MDVLALTAVQRVDWRGESGTTSSEATAEVQARYNIQKEKWQDSEEMAVDVGYPVISR